MKNPSFTLADITPIILEAIRQNSLGGLILSHQDLVSALQATTAGAALVSAAALVLKKSEYTTAAIMLAQFSKQYSDEKSIPPDIKRHKLNGRWAYQVAPTTSSAFFPFDSMMKAMDEEILGSTEANEEPKKTLTRGQLAAIAVHKLMRVQRIRAQTTSKIKPVGNSRSDAE